MNWHNFFDMGGYAFYVWSSWGLSFLIFIYMLVEAKYSNAKIKRSLKRQFSREQQFKNTN